MRDKSIQCDWTCTSLVQEAACEDAVAAYVDVAGFLFNVVKEDIICCDAGVPKWFQCSETVREKEPCEQNEVNEAVSCYVCQSSMNQRGFQYEIEGLSKENRLLVMLLYKLLDRKVSLFLKCWT